MDPPNLAVKRTGAARIGTSSGLKLLTVAPGLSHFFGGGDGPGRGRGSGLQAGRGEELAGLSRACPTHLSLYPLCSPTM